jgi:hypothetical protein
MHRTSPILLGITCLGTQLFAAVEVPRFDWLQAGGGDRNDKIRAVAFAPDGSAVLAGEVQGDAQFAGQTHQSHGGLDLVLIKLSPSGELQWLRSLGGSLTDRAYGVVVNAEGQIYVTGHFESQDARVGDQPLSNAGDYDIFLAKYDEKGNPLWIRTAGGSGYDYGHGVALDPGGDVVISGAVSGEARFGETTVNAGARARSFFAAKYDAEGALKWVRTAEGGLSGSGHGIAIDGKGNIHLGGNASGSGHWGGLSIEAGARSSLVLKMDAQGQPIWCALNPGAGVHEITVDSSGRVWAAGMFKGEASFGEISRSTSSATDNDGFLCHYSPGGELRWTRFVSSTGTDYCLGVTTDGSGRVFVTGEYSGVATFAGADLVSRGSTDIMTAAFDKDGNLEWLVSAGGPRGDNAYTIAWHPSGRLIQGGSCNAGAQFGELTMEREKANEAYGATLVLPK